MLKPHLRPWTWKRFKKQQPKWVGFSELALVILGVLFFSGCQTPFGYTYTPPQIDVPASDQTPTISEDAVFYFSGTNVVALSNDEEVVIAPDVLTAVSLGYPHVVFSKAGEDQTHFWAINLEKDAAEPLFSFQQSQTQMLPSPDGMRITLRDEGTGEVYVFTVETGDLQRVAQESSSVSWAPDSRSLLIFFKGEAKLSQINKYGEFEEPEVIAAGVEQPIGFVSSSSIFFQKETAPADQPEEQEPSDEVVKPVETERRVFTYATLTGETVDEFDAPVGKTASILDANETYVVFLDHANAQTALLSIETKTIILELPGVTQALLSTEGDVLYYIDDGALVAHNLKTSQEEHLKNGVDHLIQAP